MKNQLLRFNDALYLFCVWVAGLSLLAITLIIPWGIFARYVLGTGSRWPEPVSLLLVAVFTFLGAAASYRANAHIAVTMVTSRLPETVRIIVSYAIELLMGAICLFMLIWGIKLCMATWHQFNSTLPWLRVGLVYMSIPIGAGFTLFFVIEKLLFGEQSTRAVVCFHAEGAA
jgi:TRAP-type C4-dicarboxylate transport system permease small subunit